MKSFATWGTIRFPYSAVVDTYFDQVPGGIRVGSEVDRSVMNGLAKAEISTLDGGLLTMSQVQPWTTSLNRVWYSRGIQHHVPGVACRAYDLVTQATLQAVDASGWRAANVRAHGANSSLGASAPLLWLGAGPYLFKQTSTSDPALTLKGTLANNVSAVREMRVGGADVLMVAASGPTAGVRHTTDPVATALASWTTTFSLSSGGIWGMESFRELGAGYNLFYADYNGTEGLFYTRHADTAGTAPTQLVLADTKDVLGSLATVTSAEIAAAGSGQDSDGDSSWGTVYVDSALHKLNTFTWYGFDFSSIPPAAYVTGVRCEIDFSHSSSGSAALSWAAVVSAGGQTSGASTGSRLVSGTDSFGSTTNTLGLNLRGSELGSAKVSVKGSFTGTGGGFGDSWNITAVRLEVTYRLAGQTFTVPAGGFDIGRNPVNALQWGLVVPRRTDTSSVQVQRQFWQVDLAFDVANNRPVADPSTPNTGLDHVECAQWGLGGLVVGGDSAGTLPGSLLKFVRSDGEVLDLRMPTYLNGKAGGVTAIATAGRFVIYEWAANDGSEAQWLYYFNGQHYASTAPQTMSNAIGALPLGWGRYPIDQNQRMIYRFFPVSTTHLAAARTFIPRDLLADPLTNNTDKAKIAGDAWIQLPEMNLFGPVEASKALNVISYQGRQASAAAGAYGPLRVRIDTTGDTTMATPAVDTGAITGAFTDYNVPNAGVALKTAIVRLQADDTGATTKTPNLLPVLLTGTPAWPDVRAVTFVLGNEDDMVGPYRTWESLLTGLRALKNQKPTQPLHFGETTMVAMLQSPRAQVVASLPNAPPQLDRTAKQAPVLTFVEKLGAP